MRLIVLSLSLALLQQQQAPAAGNLPALPVPTIVRNIAACPRGAARADLYRM